MADGVEAEETSAGGDSPLVSIVIPTFNKWEYTHKCLSAIAENTEYPSFEIIVVDNASSDGTPQQLEALGGPLRLRLNPENEGFARGSNQGAAMAKGDYILFLNNDTEVRPGWMREMVRVLEEHEDVAIVGSQLLFPDGTLQHAGVLVHYGGTMPISALHAGYQKPPSEGPQGLTEFRCVTAACMLIRRSVFEEVGCFDESYVNGYEDVDLCFKVGELGHRIIYNPASVAVHHESVSEGRHRFEDRNLWLLTERWLGRFTNFDENRYASLEHTPENPGRPAVSVVVPIYQSLGLIVAVLERLLAHTSSQDEIVVVDRGSRDPGVFVARWIGEQNPGRIKVLEHTGSFLAIEEALRRGVEASSSPYVALFPPPVWASHGALDRMVARLEADPALGMVGPLTDCATGQQEVGLLGIEIEDVLNIDDFARRVHERAAEPLVVEAIDSMGACLRRELFEAAIQAEPETFYSSRGFRLPQLVRAAGHKLGIVRDVFVKSLTPPSDQGQIILRTGLQRSANHMWEEARRRLGQDPPASLWKGNLLTPQTGLASIVVLVWDNLEVTKDCLASIFEHTLRPFELILVDNGSRAETARFLDEMVEHYDNVRLVRNEENQGYAYGCNQGLAAAEGEYLVLLNNDVVVTPHWLSDQIALLSGSDQIGLVGPRTNESAGPQRVDPEDITYEGQDDLRRFSQEWQWQENFRFTYSDPLTGLCMVLRRAVVDMIGGLDTNFWIGNYEDNDFCLRIARAGYRMALAHDVFVHHEGSSTFKAQKIDYEQLVGQNWEFFCSKWGFERPLGAGFPTQQLVEGRPFDPAFDRIPPDVNEVFRPGLKPIEVEGRKPKMLLMIPEWDGDDWKKPLTDFVRSIGPDDPVGLLLRVEPPTLRRAELAVQRVGELLAELNITEEHSPDMVLDTTVLNPAARGRLYASATALLCSGGSRAALYEREATACGLPFFRGLGGEGLRLKLDALASGPPGAEASGSAEVEPSNVESIRRSVDGERPGVSILIVTYNSAASIEQCLKSLQLYTRSQDQVIVVDNLSGDSTRSILRRSRNTEMPELDVVLAKANLGFSRGVNLALERARCDLVLMLNPDTVITEGSLDSLAAHLTSDSAVGAVGPTSDWAAGLQNVGRHYEGGPIDADELAATLRKTSKGPVETKLLIGFCLMMWRQTLVDLGGLDPDLFLGNDDLDLSLRLSAEGAKLLVATDAFVHHRGLVSFKTEPKQRTAYLLQQSTNLLYEKLHRLLDGEVPSGTDLWDVSWFEPQTELLSVVLVVGDDPEATAACIGTLVGGTHRDLELVLVARDEAASLAARALVEEQEGVVHLRSPEGSTHGESLNLGLSSASGDYVLITADDVLFPRGSVAKLLALLGTNDKRGVVGPRCAFAAGAQSLPPGTADVIDDLEEFAYYWHESEAGASSAVAVLGDFCLLTRRSVLEKIGGVDPGFAPGSYRGMDLSLRLLKAGYELGLAQDVVVHRLHPERDVGDEDLPEMERFAHKWNLGGDSEAAPRSVADVVAREEFDPEIDFVPLELSESFHPDVPPLGVQRESADLLLCIPDWEAGSWRDLLGTFISSFEPGEGVGLLVRVEPPSEERVSFAVSALETAIAELGVSGGRIPEIVLEATPLTHQERGRLYTASRALLSDGGAQADVYRREALACGVDVLDAPDTQALRNVVRRP